MSGQSRLALLITAIGADVKSKVSKAVTYTANPGEARLTTNINATVTSSFHNLAETYINGALASWQNEWNALRGSAHANSKFDALARAIGRTDYGSSTHQGAGYSAFEIISSNRLNQMWGRHWLDGVLFRNAIKHQDLLVWRTGMPDPTTDTTGVFSYGEGSTNYVASISNSTFVILIQDSVSEDTPSWAPSGRTLRFNLA